MSCMFCTEYMGIGRKCRKKIDVLTGSESFNCHHYKYNRKLKVKR